MGLNLNAITYTSSDYKIVMSARGGLLMPRITVPLLTVDNIDHGAKKEHEYQHAIGSDEPFALKTNASTYPGKLTLQAGELIAYLASMGLTMATQITNATISIVSFDGLYAFIYKGVVITSDDKSIKAKDKHSLVTLSFEAIGVVGV